eukprot:361947-Chlamydomonas_euryale.AAC.1
MAKMPDGSLDLKQLLLAEGLVGLGGVVGRLGCSSGPGSHVPVGAGLVWGGHPWLGTARSGIPL